MHLNLKENGAPSEYEWISALDVHTPSPPVLFPFSRPQHSTQTRTFLLGAATQWHDGLALHRGLSGGFPKGAIISARGQDTGLNLRLPSR